MRLARDATIAAIDIPAWLPPWPITSCGLGPAASEGRPERAEPYRLGVTLLAELLRRPGFELLRDGAALTRLLGTPNDTERHFTSDPL